MFSANGLVKGIVTLTALSVLVPWLLVGPAASPSLTPPPTPPQAARPQNVDPVSVRECNSARGPKFYTVINEPKNLLCGDAYELSYFAVNTLGLEARRPRFCAASWLIQEATLCTRKQTQIAGLAYGGDLKIGHDVAEMYDRVDPRWNCHGDTFAGGAFSINPDQVDTILADEFDRASLPLRAGDIVVYRTDAGVPIHSTTLYLDSSDGQLKTYGKRGTIPIALEELRPIGPGPGAAWGNPDEEPAHAEFYRRRP